MRTSASYHFDGQATLSEVSLDGPLASIEFRGDDPSKARQHYIRVCGISPTECKNLAVKLLSAAKAIQAEKRGKGGATC